MQKNTLLSTINNIKTDFVRYDFVLLEPPNEEDGIRFLGLKDIVAMKFHAIIQSSKRLKDFIDIYYLLEKFSMKQMIDFFSEKYTYTNPMIAMKAINYFDDIDESIDPPKMQKPVSLDKIKERITQGTLHSNKIFD
ncbi:MAG: nucleotidyl transferase AbiEii/AbiGii toxin family protein [Chitinophagaceae bacterium]|nr:nucleotidyl transferase AbiEii/AbiGii toxin family protein [Chitinophagaceae bacterium]